ncbi:hypothetical protein JZ751_014654 [Albula glossodonta]|uniref:Cadherin domain-containing protein n=1 Tax=Albula glossodonta TaxID=121402 RepID=A0A8T2MY99_9TELE|nr:hypothetical protein JZ751_014654 [Albula glossodonta]
MVRTSQLHFIKSIFRVYPGTLFRRILRLGPVFFFYNAEEMSLSSFPSTAGEPPMTATATLNIYLKDINDNKPQLDIQTMGMCQAIGDTSASITASDLDEEPYSGPFRFELVGNHKGRWHLDPTYGTTVNLVKSNKVYSGEHVLTLKVYDTQEVSAEYNLTVTVCDCSVKDNCQSRSTTSTQLGRICSIQDPNVELYDYQPHVYAYEEDFIKNPCLDAISIPESNFSPDLLLDLGPRFNELANMCKPSPTPL